MKREELIGLAAIPAASISGALAAAMGPLWQLPFAFLVPTACITAIVFATPVGLRRACMVPAASFTFGASFSAWRNALDPLPEFSAWIISVFTGIGMILPGVIVAIVAHFAKSWVRGLETSEPKARRFPNSVLIATLLAIAPGIAGAFVGNRNYHITTVPIHERLTSFAPDSDIHQMWTTSPWQSDPRSLVVARNEQQIDMDLALMVHERDGKLLYQLYRCRAPIFSIATPAISMDITAEQFESWTETGLPQSVLLAFEQAAAAGPAGFAVQLDNTIHE